MVYSEKAVNRLIVFSARQTPSCLIWYRPAAFSIPRPILPESTGNVRKLLQQGGHFVNLKITQTNLARSLVGFGSLPGRWLSTEDWRQNGPLMSKETWDRVMKQTGFFGIEATRDDGEGGCIMITHATAEFTSEPSEQLGFSNQRTLAIVVLDNFSELQQTIADRIYQWSGLGSRIITLGEVGAVEWKEDDVVLSLIELGEPLLVAQTSEVFENIRTMIKNTQNLLWVALPNLSAPPSSTGAVDPLFEAALGFLRTIRYKEPSKEIVTLSCCNGVTLSEANVVRFIKDILCKQVYATVGFDDKKKLLMEEFDIPESNIFYSRDTSFKLGILRETAGRGVDVVLNSLSGDKLKASWSCIAPFGRFIEIGKADIGAGSSLPMSHFAKNATFSAVDLAHLGADDPDALRDLMRTAVDLLYYTNVGQ